MVIYLIYNMTMTKVNVAEAKAGLSGYLNRVANGETIIVCRRNVPIAELRPISTRRTALRSVGIDRGMTIPDSFFEPLPSEVIDAFEGVQDRNEALG